MNNSEIKLNLIDNSHGYINEAVDYAIKAKKDARKWQFAILNLVQGLELSLKSLLFKIYPAFIFDNLDKINTNKNIKTVAPLQAYERLKNPAIGNILFAKNDEIKLEKAIFLRNQMIHSEFSFFSEFATIKFLDVFAFLVHFQAVYLKTEIETIISKESLEEILTMKESIKVLLEKAKQRIKEENIKPENVWECPDCENETFVIDSDVCICYTCRCEEEIFECEKCGNYFFEWELEDFSNEFETDYCEGETIIYNNYGYDYHKACSECVEEIKEDIEQQCLDNYHELMEHEWQSKNLKKG